MKTDDLTLLNAARHERRAAILLTDLASGKSSVIVEGGAVPAELAEIVRKAFRTGKSVRVEVDGHDLFLNVQVPPPRIVVIGAVHISQVLAPMARIAGYDLSIIDPRTAFATPERFAGIDLAADWPEDVLKERPLDGYSALVAVTHDPKIDDFPIAAALQIGRAHV
jgi:xanthine dehydrogenase accessory factor